MLDPNKTSVVGASRSLDPTTEVGNTHLGLHYCEVYVNVPVEINEELIKPYHNF